MNTSPARRESNALYTASLFILIALTALCLAVSAADVIIQALADKNQYGQHDYRNLFVVGGSYVLLGLLAFIFSCSRLFTVRRSLADIPKLHIPISEYDLPKKVHKRIQEGFTDIRHIRSLAEPKPEDVGQLGWAKPGSEFEGVNFKRAITRTSGIIEKAAIEMDQDFVRPAYIPFRQYVEFLSQHIKVDRSIVDVYLDGYERARFSQDEFTEAEYLGIMGHLAIILRSMGYLTDNDAVIEESIGSRAASSRIYASSGSSMADSEVKIRGGYIVQDGSDSGLSDNAEKHSILSWESARRMN
ncbi:hypothetical protein K450DRAFT_253519 [Umbelopsis ramanniana AG]|uniref:Defect at low temperature protein 1 n=1 Tax=Umbelopsis ramanniana AG TaxID=1314678 RepID=A0AAD5E571_UMBRA|nr:uncharacterized protein K450DRAFT_253519 [Umbelopsis ramanniana AG]KAI8577072.1 hypothetical protein K450DRAFT_253519 [Umbelopsis ramanniana AG]